MKYYITILISIFLLITSCSESEDDVSEPKKLNECFDESYTSNFSSRDFKMGFSTWNYGPDLEDINDTYSFIGKNADIYSEQVDDVIPWNALINDEPLPSQFINQIDGKVSRKIPGHKLLLSVSLLNTERNDLIAGFDGNIPEYSSLNDEAIRSAYVKHLSYLIDRMNPDYLILAMEANDLYLRDSQKWEEFKSLMQEVRSEIKTQHPSILLSESMTLHNWFDPDVDNPSEYIAEIASYIENLDFASISFYPFFKAYNTKIQYQEAFDFLYNQVNKPIAMVETAHLAEDLNVPRINLSLPSDECQQNDYLEVLLENAQQEKYEFVIWWTHRDYDKLWNTFPEEVKEIGGLWKDTGILDENGVERASFDTWKSIFLK